ncbi:hypothetical protein CDL15_Pgr019175 [Punica granatum]|uniref:Uncharacterized protein n=1 Tax=Punica granatum TaxID=22663 RepID=A0A218XZH4_PUNGR|nr:hypothetical protein CDL15_Pgr019175 [Punica granatum]
MSDGCDGWMEGGDGCEGNSKCVVEGVSWEVEPPAMGGKPRLGAVQSEPRVEPWLGVEPRLDGLARLSCGSHLIERKAGKYLGLD